MFCGRLNLVTGPTVEPVTACEVKTHARVAHDVEDKIINQWIKAARKLAEDFQKKSYVTQTWRALFDGWPALPIDFPMSPLRSVSSVKYYDTDDTEYTLDTATYHVDTLSEVGRLTLNYGETWPTITLRPANSVIIDYVAGYGEAVDVPETIIDAIYTYCTYRYENREGEIPIPEAFYNILRPDRMAV